MSIKKLYILLIASLSLSVKAQCPFGNGTRVECKYGCDNYIDKDGKGYCDYSRPIAREATDTAITVLKTDVKPASSKQAKRHRNLKLVKTTQSAESAIDTTDISSEETNIIAESPSAESKPPFKKPYHLILISALTLGSYFLTFLLSRIGILHKVYHRRIWNLLLLLTAAVSCLFGLLLVIQVNYGFLSTCYRPILTWHVECGIAMTIIAVFHAIWHFSYYKGLFKRVGKK